MDFLQSIHSNCLTQWWLRWIIKKHSWWLCLFIYSFIYLFIYCSLIAQVQSKPSQTSKTERFSKRIIKWKSLNIFVERSIFDVSHGSEYGFFQFFSVALFCFTNSVWEKNSFFFKYERNVSMICLFYQDIFYRQINDSTIKGYHAKRFVVFPPFNFVIRT